MSKDAFKNLDNLILEQPELIDLTDEITDVVEDKTSTLESDSKDKTPKDKSKGVKEEDLIDIDTVDTTEVSTPEGANKPTQEDLLKGWGDYFKENTILSEDDLEGFDGSIQSLNDSFQKREVRVGLEMVDDYKSQLPDMLKYLADNWEEGVPLTELLNIKSNQIRYSNVTDEKLEDSVDTQKAVYAEYLRKTTKYSETKIEKEISRLVDLDELKDETKEALAELKKFEAEAEDTIRRETKREQEYRKEENSKVIKAYEKYSKETKEVIPGLKIDDKLQSKVLNNVINPVGIDGHGNQVSYIQSIRNTDPIGFDFKLNYFMEITKGMTDFSKITNAVTTKATEDLSKMIGQSAPKTGKDGIDTTTKKSVLDYLQMPQNKK